MPRQGAETAREPMRNCQSTRLARKPCVLGLSHFLCLTLRIMTRRFFCFLATALLLAATCGCRHLQALNKASAYLQGPVGDTLFVLLPGQDGDLCHLTVTGGGTRFHASMPVERGRAAFALPPMSAGVHWATFTAGPVAATERFVTR